MAKKKTAPQSTGETMTISPQAKLDRQELPAGLPIGVQPKGDRGFLIGLHQEVLSLTDDAGKTRMAVKSGAGLGSDRLVLVCDDQECVVFMRDLLRVWVQTVNPQMAASIPESPLTAKRDDEPSFDVWGEDPEFPRKDWQYEVGNGDTNLGYWDWVAHAKEVEKEKP